MFNGNARGHTQPSTEEGGGQRWFSGGVHALNLDKTDDLRVRWKRGGRRRGSQAEERIYIKAWTFSCSFPQNFAALSYSGRSGFGKILLPFKSFLGDLLTSAAEQRVTPQKLLAGPSLQNPCSWICSRNFLRGKDVFLQLPVCHRNWCLPWRKIESQWMRTLAEALE